MRRLKEMLLHDDDGTTAVEYAVMLAMIVMLCVAGIAAAGRATSSSLQNTSTQISNAMGGS